MDDRQHPDAMPSLRAIIADGTKTTDERASALWDYTLAARSAPDRRDEIAACIRTICRIIDNDVEADADLQKRAIKALFPLSPLLASTDSTLGIVLETLRRYWTDNSHPHRYVASSAYNSIIGHCTDESPFLHVEMESLIHIAMNAIGEAQVYAARGGRTIAPKIAMTDDTKQRSNEAFRDILAEAAAINKITALWTFETTIPVLGLNGDTAAALARSLLMYMSDEAPSVRAAAVEVFDALITHIATDIPVVCAAEEILRIARRQDSDPFTRKAADLAHEKLVKAVSMVDEDHVPVRHINLDAAKNIARQLARQALAHIHCYNIIKIKSGFWKDAHIRGDWMRKLGLSDTATEVLRHLSRRDTSPLSSNEFNNLLSCLVVLSADCRAVINAVIETTRPDDRGSIDDMLRTVHKLSLFHMLPADRIRDFYHRTGMPHGDIHAGIQDAVRYEFNSFIRERLGDVAPIASLLPRNAEEDAAGLMALPDARAVEGVLHDSGAIALLAASSTFMNDDGVRILTSFVEDLAFSRVDDDGIDYARRYERMISRLGFDPSFVDRWKKDWRTTTDDFMTVITGRPEVFAWHGMVPACTCQRLMELYEPGTNGSGQPINRLRWGHIKVAYHLRQTSNGMMVVCKRIIEVTRDKFGQEFLRVGPLYAVTEGVVHMLDRHIDRYAEELDIPPSRIRFPDRDRGTSSQRFPGPLQTGDRIVHDSGHYEVNPITFQEIPPVAPPPAVPATPPINMPGPIRK